MKLPTLSVVVAAVCIGLSGLINGAVSEPLSDFLNSMSIKSFKIALQNEPGDFVFSPLAISHLLSKITDGMSGETLSELEAYIPMKRYEISGDKFYKVLVDSFYPIPQWNTNTLNINNKIYAKMSVRPQCQKFISAISPFRIEQLNFDNTQNSKNIINNWIQNDNNFCLKERVETDDVENINGLLLMSVIKFKAGWKYGFTADSGVETTFFLSKKRYANARLFSGKWRLYMSNNKDLNATIVKLPYQMPHGQRPVSMFIIVPNEIDGLKHVENNIDKINKRTLQDLKRHLVHLHLPSFQLETKIDIKEHLKKMGIKKAFTTDAEFTGNDENNNCSIHISKIIQKATISIDDEGTGATAASYNDEFEWPQSEDVKIVRADRPFLVVMVAGDLILFTGRVTKPQRDELCRSITCRMSAD